jgi:hypothetical protein
MNAWAWFIGSGTTGTLNHADARNHLIPQKLWDTQVEAIARTCSPNRAFVHGENRGENRRAAMAWLSLAQHWPPPQGGAAQNARAAQRLRAPARRVPRGHQAAVPWRFSMVSHDGFSGSAKHGQVGGGASE